MKDEQHGCAQGKKDPGPFFTFELVPPDLYKQNNKRQKEKNRYGPGPAG